MGLTVGEVEWAISSGGRSKTDCVANPSLLDEALEEIMVCGLAQEKRECCDGNHRRYLDGEGSTRELWTAGAIDEVAHQAL